MTTQEIIRRQRKLISTFPRKEADERCLTLRQFNSMGLDDQAIDHLLMAVPVTVRMRAAR